MSPWLWNERSVGVDFFCFSSTKCVAVKYAQLQYLTIFYHGINYAVCAMTSFSWLLFISIWTFIGFRLCIFFVGAPVLKPFRLHNMYLLPSLLGLQFSALRLTTTPEFARVFVCWPHGFHKWTWIFATAHCPIPVFYDIHSNTSECDRWQMPR